MAQEEEKDKSNTVSIPEALFKKIEGRIKGGPFGSVSEYVTYVLQEAIAEEEEKEEELPTEEYEKKVKERLRALGYVD